MPHGFDYIDIHGHVNFPEFDADRESVIGRARAARVAMITVGTDLETSARAVQLAEAHEHMWATVGVHPTDSGGPIDFEALERLACHPKVVAIGECGLDYLRAEVGDVTAQKEAFEEHIRIAQKTKKPLMLHVRNGKAGSVNADRNAYGDALSILKEYPDVSANFHFFAGTSADLDGIIARGYSVSFTGVVSFTHDYDELVRRAPLSRIMSETDCPFVSPAPHRGKMNEPLYVVEVVKAIAKARGQDEGVVARQLLDNAKSFFKL